MSFPWNTPPPPRPDPDYLPSNNPLGGWPADAAEAEPPAPTRLAWARQRFWRYERPPLQPGWRYALHLGLFLLTLASTVVAGLGLMRGTLGDDWLPLDLLGLPATERWVQLRWALGYALPFVGVLGVHEFGHYFVARRNRVRTTLPFFLPVPLGIGTFGAVIRIKERIFSRRQFFDIGIAGPLAGLAVAVPLLAYAFATLPDPAEYLLVQTRWLRHYPAPSFTLAHPLLYQLLERLFADPHRLPPPNQLLHYPLLLAGELSLFFTALNLLPIGQLDGGHLLYGLLGPRRAGRLSAVLFVAFIFYAGLGLFSVRSGWHMWLYGGVPYAAYLGLVFWRLLPRPAWGLAVGAAVWLGQIAITSLWPGTLGQPGWLLFGLLLGRLSGIYHPAAPDDRPLNLGRQVLGWATVGLFILCFAPSPFVAI
ncbi:site-2 protease family protein [Hymenobacter sp. RP-2-7]|uniref:Site-2 protease family protein n=1 Tax=Hymenobacter polaris TaxID=2682546 RepID=A0A7Y0FM41_9BACT|nr:site-2 protease family protein [Hymenobacter polaris]NML65457.1 site-2 protease family protein [Hymenobacter polaris]